MINLEYLLNDRMNVNIYVHWQKYNKFAKTHEMKTTQFKQQLQKRIEKEDKEFLNKNEIFNLSKKINPNIKSSSLQWVLFDLVKEKKLIHIAHNKYTAHNNFKMKDALVFENNEFEKKVINIIDKKNLSIVYQVFDVQKLNAILRHQINTKVVFVDVEKGYETFIYEYLMDKMKERVFLKPPIKIFSDNLGKDMVVVRNFISEAPMIKGSHQNRFEKILVDSVSDKYLRLMFSLDEVKTMYQEVRNHYLISENIIRRYSRRRNSLGKIEKIIK